MGINRLINVLDLVGLLDKEILHLKEAIHCTEVSIPGQYGKLPIDLYVLFFSDTDQQFCLRCSLMAFYFISNAMERAGECLAFLNGLPSH